MEMTEIDRELILEERREKLQKYQDRQLLKEMVANQEGGAGNDSDEEDSRPNTRRRAPQTKRAKQLEELKQRRKSKSEREEKRAKKRAQGSDYDSDEENRDRRSPSVPIYTDSEEEDGEAEKEQKASSSTLKKKGKSREPAEHDDIRKICLPRAALAKYWPCPWFGDYVEGAYVRMGVGQEKGEPIYRLAKVEKIADTPTSRLYRLENNVTNVKLTLIIGEDKKDMTMEMVSNTAPTEVRLIHVGRRQTLKVDAGSSYAARNQSLPCSPSIQEHRRADEGRH